MIQERNKKYWILWLLVTLLLMMYFILTLIYGNDKRVFMPGELTAGHYQIGIVCGTCHASKFTKENDMQVKCLTCHDSFRKKTFNSHPKEKFRDPRNIELLEKIDALHCVSCHVEHRSEIVQKGGYTQAKDFCIYCHNDIAKERPSHKDMDFMSCNNDGCHNYHNNRALYEDFLIKHQNDPDISKMPQLPEKDYSKKLEEIISYPHDKYSVRPLKMKDLDYATQQSTSITILTNWLSTSHARSGVTCNACHMIRDKEKFQWIDQPDYKQCKQCHDMEVNNFGEGKHGMRIKAGLSAMKVADSRIPMKIDSHNAVLTCKSCHAAHRFDVQQAAVKACLTCHNDRHSLSYQNSAHAKLWEKELKGELPTGSGVSCASCHMPRITMDVNDDMSRIVVMHNQNATLVPNEKMIRPVCLHCHGLEFSINALADESLVQRNFKGQPTTTKSRNMELIREDKY